MIDFEIVSIEEIHRRVSLPIEERLIPLGFELQKPLHWVRSVDAPIRQMFVLQQYKGGVVAPLWGLSLDFVPHVSGSEVKWHRTQKSARLDAVMDPRDRSLDFHYMYGPEHIAQKAPAVIPRALEEAEAFWSSAKSIAELPSVFDAIKQHMSGGGLGFYNFVQHPLAFAFVLAKVGRHEEAESELARYLQRGMKPATISRIRQLIAECAIT